MLLQVFANSFEGKGRSVQESIFISHATPEDNDFVRWLGTKLELAGYKVWLDLARLKGGDYFWNKIEAAIRNESFRFIAVVSKVSVGKQGVQDEWAVAGTVERNVPGFLIPVRLDGIEFSQTPISIHRKNLIDFAGGWHKGLTQLLDTLEDAKAKKVSCPDPAIVKHWLPEQQEGAIVRLEAKEFLDSSWLKIQSLPLTIETAKILGDARGIPTTQENRVLPWFEHEDRIVGFAKAVDLVSLMAKSVMLKPASGVDTETFVKEGSTLGEKSVRRSEARKRVGNLVRQAWELTMEAKGFACAEQSAGRKIFYVTPEMTGGRGKFVSFEDFDGRKRRKALNGRSERRGACWAYGVGIVPSFDEPWRIELRSTVVFTDDQGRPFQDSLKAHRLRRGFCRNWWNEQWRTLLRAFLWLASGGDEVITLPVGSERSIMVSAAPISFESPVGLSDALPTEDAEPLDEPDDELDLDEDEGMT